MLTRNDIQKINQDKSAITGRIYTDIYNNKYKGLPDGTVILFYDSLELLSVQDSNTINLNFNSNLLSANLKDTSVTPAGYGGSSNTLQIVVDQQGRLQYATQLPIQIGESQVTNLITDLALLTPLTRTLTINGTSYDLSADRTWSVGTVTSIGTSGLISGGTITGTGTITTSMNTNKLVGRGTAGIGIMEEITLGTNLSLSGTTLNAASPSGAALTKTDDTNVTLTLGGSPTTALLAATSLTLGWTGKLALSRFVQGTTGTVLQGITSSDSIYTSSPTISTSVTTPLIIGGTGTGSDLILQSTSGVGDDTSWIIHQVANNGNVETMRQGVALSSPASATGGTITTSGGYTIHTFTSGGTFTVSGGSLSVDYLVVAGGGGGGGSLSGGDGGCGGGAGGMLVNSTSLASGAYTITIGSGGAGGDATANRGGAGGDSIISGIATATGGGGGGAYNNGLNGGNGGSGGGGNYTGTAGTGTGGQGNNGGSDPSNYGFSGAGGGGAGAVGANPSGASGKTGGNGGAGVANSYSGSSVTYAGGGGGGAYGTSSTAGTGGSGGGGNGGLASNGSAGTANTGGGGGGGGGFGGSKVGGAGGSGIVIIRYLTPSTTKVPVIGINKSSPTAQLHIGASSGNQYTAPIQLEPGVLLSTAIAGTIEYATASNDDLWFTINTGAARKGFIFNNGSNLTSGKIPIASTNGRLIDGQTPLSGTKVYYVADSSGGAVTRKLTFINGILTSET